MSEPYLILHKVRGEPAFDIAEQMEVDGEVWWIVPTSGHRAYPCEKWALSTNGVPELEDAYSIPDLPEDWPDHYAVSASRERLAAAASDLLSLIGLKPKTQPEAKRRKA